MLNSDADWLGTRWLLSCLSPYSSDPPLPVDLASWQAILNAADRGLVLPRLAAALSSRESEIPTAVRDHLRLARELNRLRNLELQRQIVTLVRELNAANIVPVVMKGATTLLDSRLDVGDRVMLDIDIWAPSEEDQERSIKGLLDLGYKPSAPPVRSPDSQHFPPFFLDGALSRVELHCRMAEPLCDHLVDEKYATEMLTERVFEDVRFRLLDSKSALTLSYIQCRWASRTNHVTIMKWIDYLDRLNSLNNFPIRGLRDIGLRDDGTEIDIQLLTALAELCDMPYSGRLDRSLVKVWQQSYRDPVGIRLLRNILGNGLDYRHWQNKSATDVWKAVSFRLSNLRSSFDRARTKDTF